MSKLILACDPGITGAWALFDAGTATCLCVEDMPVIRDQKIAFIDGDQWSSYLMKIVEGRSVLAIVERVSPNPINGGSVMFSQGLTLGSVVQAVRMNRYRMEFVAPQTWKRALGLIFPKETKHNERKRASLDKARLLFPNAPLERQKDNGRAEALLIGHWYLQTRVAAKVA